MIWVLITIFVVGLFVALSKRPNDKNPIQEHTATPPKRKLPKVRSYSKYQKKVNQRKGKIAMFRANNVLLTIDEANSFLTHDGTPDEMRLLDLILDAKLSGDEHIIIDRPLYDRLKNKISL